MTDFLMNVGVPLAFVGGTVYLFYRAFRGVPDADADAEEQEDEQEEPTPEPIKADIVAKQIQANNKTYIYNRLQGDLDRIEATRAELEKVEKLITSIESYAYFLSNGQLEKSMNFSIATFGGEQLEYSADMIQDAESREMLLSMFLKRRERLRTSLLEQITHISEYAVTNTDTKTIDYNALRGVVQRVLNEVQGA